MTPQKLTDAATLKTVNSARGTLNRGLFLLEFAVVTSIWAAALGAGVLFLKVIGWHEHVPVLPLLLTYPPVLLWAGVRAGRRRYSLLDAAAWLELKAALGGSLLSAVEHPEGGFEPDRVKAERVRAVTRSGPVLRRLWLPLLFLAGAMVVPGRREDAFGGAGARALRRRAEAVEERIDRSRNLKLLSRREAAMLEDKLAGIRANADRSPEAAGEALDGLQQRLDNRILEKAGSSAEALKELSRLEEDGLDSSSVLETLGKMLTESPEPGMLSDDLRKSLRRLMEDMQQMGGEFKGLGLELDERTLQKLMESLSTLSAEDLAQYAEMLQQMDPELMKLLSEALKNAEFERLEACSGAVRSMSAEELKEMLRKLIEEGRRLRLGLCPRCGGSHQPGEG